MVKYTHTSKVKTSKELLVKLMGQQHLHTSSVGTKFSFTTQSSFLFHCYIYVLLLNFLGCVAQLLPPEEVQTLKAIATKLEIKHWRVTRSSCGGDGGFQGGFLEKLSNVTCDCTFSNNSVCHVTNIRLNALNLTGELPSEFSRLAFLQELDLTQNYINGTIPITFGQLRLKILRLMDNRISGSIPPEIADIDTLEELIIGDNQMGGPLPPELGRLRSLRRLYTSNLGYKSFTPFLPAPL